MMVKRIVILFWCSLLIGQNPAHAVLTSGGDEESSSKIVSSKDEEVVKPKKKPRGTPGKMSIQINSRRKPETAQAQATEQPQDASLGKPKGSHPHATKPRSSNIEVRTVKSKHKPPNTVSLRGRAYSTGGGTVTGAGGPSTVQLRGTASGSRRIVEGSEE